MALLNKEMATKNTIKILEKELADDNFLLTLFRDLINGLKGELGNYKQQRNELINDIAKLRERNAELEHDNKSLRLQANIYFDKWADSMVKAFAFEKVERCIVWFEENDRYEFEGQILEIQQIINELEANND